jgi:hypothetical protein
MKFTIYASLHEEIDAGRVWLLHPTLTSRCVVSLHNKSKGKKVFCEALQIEENFTRQYNREQTRHQLKHEGNPLVISAWYRKHLGAIPVQSEQEIEIEPADNHYGKLRACLQHPQIVVRIGTCLGLISVALGVLGLLLGGLSLK